MPRGRSTTTPAEVMAQQAARCYELRLKGLTIRAIAAELNLPPTTVKERLDRYIADLVLPLADEVRLLELDRLDTWLRKLEERIDDGEDPVRVVPVLLKVQERRSRYLGLDAPVKTDVVVDHATPDARVLALVRAAQEASEADLAALREESAE